MTEAARQRATVRKMKILSHQNAILQMLNRVNLCLMEIYNMMMDAIISTRDENSSEITPVTTPLQSRPPKRSSQVSLQQADLTNKVLLSVNEHFTRPKVQEDRFDIFGKNVAMKLQDLPMQQRLLAERIINAALFEAEMGTLTTSHKFILPPQRLFHTMTPSPQQNERQHYPQFDLATPIHSTPTCPSPTFPTQTTSHSLGPSHSSTQHYQHQAHPYPSPQIPSSVQHEHPPCPQLAGVHSDTVASISAHSPSAASYLSNLSGDDL
ncbi:uncharacterized protein LOC117282419 [Cryptotermes secundus]|uniref:uncharacterized protein LOC117282419 n=1 Tax=Cryptotermes secundus TaxID=105785 RepID=UPI001454C758|nr:uncharacterized protein LOC117282419 [Cryptotermes secundus]